PQEFEEATFEVSTEPTAISPVDEPISGKFRLRPNYPNPFNPLTHIPLEVGGTNPVNVRLTVYNMLGQKVITLADKKLAPGTYEVTWDGRNSLGRSVSSGIYFYEMIAGSQRFIRKMFLIR
ncbi:MAG: T9SS type A sorting domain-containing protein, partial [Calditrichae bacterium]|nr:T9SS type A sorting domain-containing protein [Calditrichia bacterium]